ncbi:MAG TPA: hypothetical protein VL400_06770 [Polyangiaceae bacterium]|nr:hypothetical protein [Polyangiaceae bacterium]
MRPSLLLVALALVATTGCRAHPCGDRSADLPKALEGLPLLAEGGRVCDAEPAREEATIRYWGGKDRLAEVAVQLIAKMDDEGWAQYEVTGEYAPRKDPEHPVLIFRKGSEEIGVRLSVDQTPRLGAKLPADSVVVHVSHRTLTEKEQHRR